MVNGGRRQDELLFLFTFYKRKILTPPPIQLLLKNNIKIEIISV